MVTELEFGRDTSLGILSVSALLLTVLLGFVSPSLPRTQYLTGLIVVATFGLYSALGLSALSLYCLTLLAKAAEKLKPSKSEKWESALGYRLWSLVYTLQFFSFVGGLGGIFLALIFILLHV